MNVLCDADSVDWGKAGGLVPAIVQDARSLRVLMLGYMSPDSLQQTLETGLVTFFSRSRQRLWQKGEVSGHILRVREIRRDCDRDALLVLAEPVGPTCHLGTQSCFGDEEGPSLATIAALAATIRARHLSPKADSYTSNLFGQGVTRIAQKVGEEAVEAALAAGTGSPTLAAESADLLYHLLVLLEARETDWMDVIGILHERAAPKPG
ncbi:MAG TPA: bifunctional phosphoribosyl-AMP cyclohydrolase/phosphoribosyl-ATP diphosphatase HisIE [Rhizomicrobium sp.]|jgi:phosphoribosyl-ATP pyrophosphohydrolase/phosphoribosyl-AMP cyclohydrolase|nr:bifunctional phosphoribosyl-AMP cyclohydrolase/phosphoribosyl-ATP diphosphatase HisIE [Rhizomicrobium sp.]